MEYPIQYCKELIDTLYTPVAEEDGQHGGAADDGQVSPGGESHGQPGDGHGGHGVADHDHEEGDSSTGDSTIFNNWNIPVRTGRRSDCYQ